MNAYQVYIDHLRRLYVSCHGSPGLLNQDQVNAALNGQAGTRLRELVDIQILKNSGAFFSGSLVAKKLFFDQKAIPAGLIYDPACGAGDLLLVAASRLPVKTSLVRTLEYWGTKLAGTDIHEGFIRAAHTRLALLALSRGATSRSPLSERSLAEFFPNIRVGDAFDNVSLLKQSGLVVVNPPFNRVPTSEHSPWATGLTSNAAKFVAWIVEHAQIGTEVRAILPDVLRSGSSYHKFRDQVGKRLNIEWLDCYGQFDKEVDIDVFLMGAQISSQPELREWGLPPLQSQTFGDYFKISVGPYVPFRADGEGDLFPYIHPRELEAWREMSSFPTTKNFRGTLLNPPFVAIRRTSRPGDEFRTIATIIRGKQPIIAENHLIICVPRDGSLLACRAALKRLKDPRTREWFDRRLRCRHLTVVSVKDLPWWTQTDE